MLDILILAFGRLKESWWRQAAEEYVLRLRPYVRLKIEELKPESFSAANQEEAKKIEGERLQKRLTKQGDAAVFLLSENGRQLDSHGFACFLEKQTGTIVLVIGGSLGFASDISMAYPRLSLSDMTFPHEMARVVLLEQIYRSATIIKGKEYHY